MHHQPLGEHRLRPRTQHLRHAARVAAIGLVSAGVLAVASCANPPGTPRERAGRCNVGIVGDSLLVGAQDSGALGRRLFDNVCSVTVSDAKVGRPVADGASIVSDWAESGSLPAILVVELGTNDCSAQTFERHAREIIASAGPTRPIVWVNTWRPGCDASINEVIDELRRESRKGPRHGRFWVVDHHRWIEQHRRYLAPDGIHLTSEGYGAFAQRLVDALGVRRRT